MSIWNPWIGCHKKSEGCYNCYIHRANVRKGIDTKWIHQTDDFYKVVAKDKKGAYKIKSGQMVYICFNSDFLIEEADAWRVEAWDMIRERSDLNFLFLTKRIERFSIGLPSDFTNAFTHVTVGVSVENQARADERIPLLKAAPITHKMIILQPMLEPIEIEAYLDASIELVVVGGESGKDLRPLDFDWVLSVREQCVRRNVSFEFRQLGSTFIKDGKTYYLNTAQLCAQARKADIGYTRV